MSRHGSPGLRWLACAGVCALGSAIPATRAQTIADYSRAQRAMLESAMTQAAARSAGLPSVASAPAPGGPAPAPAAPVAHPPLVRVQADAVAPTLRVSGVFATSASTLAEVIVNGAAYLLAAGQGVPGTAWRVESVAVDRVVLSRHESGAVAVGAEPARRIFALPVLR
jgi:type IV pilus biogenesis protein PilP